MGKIHTISEQVVSKIAAGEIIERPVFAVKELLENAIDAGADSITIRLEDAGFKKISVIDNGQGMSKEDVQLAFLPHTTSKISDEKDLYNVKTLGFRGEALASIAAISLLNIKSKPTKKVAGTEVEILAGKLQKILPVGMPQGTTVTVSNLFYNVPARQKVLKDRKKEFRQILELITHYAISFPSVKFLLIHNNRIFLDIKKIQTIEERIQTLLGNYLFGNLLPIKFEETYLKITGFLAKPQLSAKNMQKQYLFLNGRKINDKTISLAVKEAYGNLLESIRYPIFILFLEVPHQAVDVNIHPRKEYVNFINKQLIFELISKAVSETLAKFNLTFANVNWFDEKSERHSAELNSYAGEVLKQSLPWEVKSLSSGIKPDGIQQIHSLYLVVQTASGIMLIDQHAAHERILYEKLLEEFKKQQGRVEKYTLPHPLPFELSIDDVQILKDNNRVFKKTGFEIEHFKDFTYKIIAVPIFFRDQKIIDLIKEFLEDLAEERNKTVDSQSDKLLKYIACKTAIKAGDPIDKKQAKKLIEELEKTPNNYTCPHGRPTRVEINLGKINKAFKR